MPKRAVEKGMKKTEMAPCHLFSVAHQSLVVCMWVIILLLVHMHWLHTTCLKTLLSEVFRQGLLNPMNKPQIGRDDRNMLDK